jgi:hypothetical protein
VPRAHGFIEIETSKKGGSRMKIFLGSCMIRAKKNLKSFIFVCLFSQQVQCHDQIIQISIIKTGSFLLAKCINLLTGRSPIGTYSPVTNSIHYNRSAEELMQMTNLLPQHFWFSHLFYTKEREEFFNKDNFIKFFIYRDPRDQMVSFIFFMDKYSSFWPHIKNINFDQALMYMIQNGPAIYKDHPPVNNILDMYEHYLPWIEAAGFLTVKFEDLVGVKGGGNEEKQIDVIKKIAQHLKIEITNQKINYVINNLFGDTATFREGKIGSWKKYFKPQHIKAFKEHTGDLLIKLGYEKDNNW